MNRKLTIGLLILMGGILLVQAAQASSIYKQGRASHSSMFADFKARKIGDVVNILIIEQNSASEVSQVDTNKKHNTDFRLTHLFGAGSRLFPGKEGDDLTRLGFQGANEFGGKAQTSNTGRVSAQLSATVKEVLPNGNLLIEGRRAIYINKEQKNIILTGVVRPMDINSDNTVLSTSIADAAITFEGFGDVTNQSQPGLLSRLLGWIPLF